MTNKCIVSYANTNQWDLLHGQTLTPPPTSCNCVGTRNLKYFEYSLRTSLNGDEDVISLPQARAIRERIGYSDNIMNDDYLNNEYKDVRRSLSLRLGSQYVTIQNWLCKS